MAAPTSAVDILLIEDNTCDEEIFLGSLRTISHPPTVACVRDGVEALEFLSKTCLPNEGKITSFPKVILLDLNLPRIDGFQFLEHIKQHHLLKSIPIIIFTGSPDVIDIQRCYRLGANGYMVKPTDYADYTGFLNSFCDYWLRKNSLPKVLSGTDQADSPEVNLQEAIYLNRLPG